MFVICFPQIRGSGYRIPKTKIQASWGGHSMSRTLTRFAVLFSFLLPSLFAQFGSGIQGTIVDSSGAVVPNVQVVLTNLATGVKREVVSSDTGVYRVLSLGAGTYSVKAIKDGFVAVEEPSIELAAN